MGKIFCFMGKSASGKDTIYKRLLADKELSLHRIVLYTTRPIRVGEVEGVEYHFTDEAGLTRIKESGNLIELREYNTCHGVWKYFTVADKMVNQCALGNLSPVIKSYGLIFSTVSPKKSTRTGWSAFTG